MVTTNAQLQRITVPLHATHQEATLNGTKQQLRPLMGL